MKVVALLQARMNSTRLPGKVIKEINGLPLIVHIYRRLLACRELDGVMVCQGPVGEDDIIQCCLKYAMDVRNSWVPTDEDLLGRIWGMWRKLQGIDAFVRVTADCLFHDPTLIDGLVEQFRSNYRTSCSRGISNWPYRIYSEGVDAEVWSTELLAELDRTPECPRENFAAWICNNDDRAIRYKVALGMQNKKNEGEPHLSIDTQEDFDRAEKMLKLLGNDEWRYEKTLEVYWKVMAEE